MDTSGTVQLAQNILRNNDYGGYTIPTEGLYPFQWNWDSAFSALGWSTFDPDRAMVEIKMLLSGQWKNGMIPHILFHKNSPNYFPGPDFWQAGEGVASSAYSQPPVLASILRKILKKNAHSNVRSQIEAYFPQVLKSHRWFWNERNPTGKGLICILHPWESGRDNLPDWDQGLQAVNVSTIEKFTRKDTQHVNSEFRPLQEDYKKYLSLVEIGKSVAWNSERMMQTQPFVMIDVLMTSVLLRANRDLLEIAKEFNLKKAGEEISNWIDVAENNFSFLWNPEKQAYCTYDLKRDTHVNNVSSATFTALYAGAVDGIRLEILCKTFDRWLEKVRYAVPSFDPGSALFEEKRYWRGPTWLIINHLIWQGFKEYGKTAQAQRILSDSLELVSRHGFWEYYSPFTGEGIGGKTFSWSAAVWLDWMDT